MKRLFSIILAGAVSLSALPAVRAAGRTAPGISAASAVLMDAASGRVLYEKDSHTHRLIASITKLMTALVALESGHALDETVTVAPEWTGAEGSSLYLRPGEEITLEALLYGLLLRSGNDAALAVAGNCGGTVERFVAEMNEKARELGMKDSRFANPSGLNADGHYSSAYDMALLARACLENETLAKIAATKSITLGTRTFTNHNKLLWRYEGCIGLKTGFTEKAGRTLVSAAERDGMTLICVTLNAPNDWQDHTSLFDYGFANYQPERLTCEGEVLCRLPADGSLLSFCPVAAERTVSLCLTSGETVRQKLALDFAALTAPVPLGTRVGEAVFYMENEVLARVPLVTASELRHDLAPERKLFPWLSAR